MFTGTNTHDLDNPKVNELTKIEGGYNVAAVIDGTQMNLHNIKNPQAYLDSIKRSGKKVDLFLVLEWDKELT